MSKEENRDQIIGLNMSGAMMLGAIADFTGGEERDDLFRRQLGIISQLQRVLGVEPRDFEAMVEDSKKLYLSKPPA